MKTILFEAILRSLLGTRLKKNR